MSDSRWYFTEEQLANSPSRKCGINAEQELSYRQRAANLIQEMGQRLQVSQLCINTAIVYMHRFYAFHSFTLFHRNSIAAAAFFLAAKVEEQPRKLEHVIKILNICLEKNENTRESYAEQAQELVFNENVLLQTLGFDVAIDHPHTHVVRACQLFNIVTVSRELRQTCYFMASNSLHLTTMCLKYRPTVVAAFCIYIACKWSRWEIPDSSEGKAWYSYVDENVTTDILKKLTDEYLQILERSPSKFKSKMKAITSSGQTALNTNPSVHGRDDVQPASTHHKSQHDKHHHHHRSSSTSNNVRKQQQPTDATATTTSSKQQPPQPVASQASTSFKNQPNGAMTSSHLPRQRPSSSSQQQQQPPYPSNDTATTQKPASEDRTQHRTQMVQELTPFVTTMLPRPLEPQKQQRTSSSQQQPANMSQPSQHQTPVAKPSSHDQRHSQSASSKSTAEYHQKSAKHPGGEFQNRSSSSSTSHSQPQQQPQMSHKKPNWPQQSSTSSSHPGSVPKSGQNNLQSSQSQPGLSSSSSNNSRNSQALPSYSESTKQTSASQPTTQNDYWFNDVKLEPPMKAATPPRLSKSMFSPSPEHDAFDRTKLMMMAANVKRESPKSDKQDRRSSTPNKREKRAEMNTTPTSHKSDRKPVIPKLENSSAAPLPDAGSAQMKKRPFSSVDDGTSGEFNRDSKSRKLDTVKSEPAMMKQPIETNPDIVKSLLQECYTSNKFDFGMDSPLDVINPDPTNQPSLIELNDLLMPKVDHKDNGLDEEHHKQRNKSKKKKEKHRHKKKKSHKSDREDRDERKDTSLKIILSNKSDSKSSPESLHAPVGLRIKIPIKDVNKTDLAGGAPLIGLPPAPLKLKISKEKIGGFNNSGQTVAVTDGGGSSSSSSNKKKDKDRSKSKSSKHGNNNNNSEFKDAGGYQHQQLSVNKMNSQVPMQQQHQSAQNNFDMASLFGGNNFEEPSFYNNQQHNPQQPMMNSQQQQQQFQNYNDYYNPNMNFANFNSNGSGSGTNKK